MSNLRQVLNDFDYSTAEPHDIATLLEQVFAQQDPRERNGGPVIQAIGVLAKYTEAVRFAAAPRLKEKMDLRVDELGSVRALLDRAVRHLEDDLGKAR